MKVQLDLQERAMALTRSSNRATGLLGARGEARSFGERVRFLLRSGDEGSALVEFALILPMMLLLTTGILVFGVAMNNYLQLTNAVSVGARTLAVNAQITLDPCAVASSAVIAAAPGLTASKLAFSYTLNGVAYSPTSNSCASSTVDSGAAGNLSSGSTATVTATYPLNLSVFGKKYSASSAVLQASSTELVQ